MTEDSTLKMVVEIFLNEPKEYLEFKNIRVLLNDISESEIRRSLQELEEHKILEVSRPRGRPKGDKKVKLYKISLNEIIFEQLLDSYYESGVEVLFGSNYTNYFIKKNGFECVFEAIKDRLSVLEFRKTATDILLALPATIGEYEDETRFVKEYFSFYERNESKKEEWIESPRLIDFVVERPIHQYFRKRNPKKGRNTGLIIKNFHSNFVEMLKLLYPIGSVKFHRAILHKKIKKLFSKLHETDQITLGLSKFMEYDNYLSPFTSYPIYPIEFLLFSYPFQRIYNDVYLLNKYDLSCLCHRASHFYIYFSDLLFEHFRNSPSSKDILELWTKQFIFQWNMARLNFDSIYEYLLDLYRLEVGSGMYHVQTNGSNLKVVDLETNNLVPDYQEIISEDEGLWEPISPPILTHLFAGLETDVYDPYTNLIS